MNNLLYNNNQQTQVFHACQPLELFSNWRMLANKGNYSAIGECLPTTGITQLLANACQPREFPGNESKRCREALLVIAMVVYANV